MVQADEKKIHAIINTVKGLPVECKNFETADSWVGVVIELENILSNFVEEELPAIKGKENAIEEMQKVEIRYAPPENTIRDGEVTDNG